MPKFSILHGCVSGERSSLLSDISEEFSKKNDLIARKIFSLLRGISEEFSKNKQTI